MSTADRRPTVLLAEDDRRVARLYTEWLEPTYAVQSARHGIEALKRLDRDIDVVLLDRKMPRLSGDEVLGILRNLGAPCRVAILSAYEPDFDIYERGYDDYLVKPIAEDELRRTVENLLRRKRYLEGIDEYYGIADIVARLQTGADTDLVGGHADGCPVSILRRLADLDRELKETLEHLNDSGELTGLFYDITEVASGRTDAAAQLAE